MPLLVVTQAFMMKMHFVSNVLAASADAQMTLTFTSF